MNHRLGKYQVDVPEGRRGRWRVERFEVSRQDAALESLRATFNAGVRGRFVPQGRYTRLTNGSLLGPMMSDTPDEIRDHLQAIRRAASGLHLVNGLGLGVVTNAMLLNPDNRVTVVEYDQDVIDLVAPHWKSRHGDRLEIVHADALSWAPPKGIRYGVVWHDIWADICADNVSEMKTLHRKYGRRCDWQGSWCRRLCERLR